MFSLPGRRIATVTMVLWLAMFAGWGGPVSAETGDGAPITISIVPEGMLDIGWASASVAFLVNGQAPTINATTPSVVATASFILDVTDTRPLDTRASYQVAISAGTFTAENASTTIAPSMLSIQSISGLPDGYSAVNAIGKPLDSSVTILSVPQGAAAVDATITITVAMKITPGVASGEYSGGITYSILPADTEGP